MIDWSSLIKTVLMIGTFLGEAKLQQRHPLGVWAGIGSAGWVQVVNAGPDSQTVRASAPAVDSVVRELGVVPPGEERIFRLPYADARVRVDVGGRWEEFDVRRPGVWWISVTAVPVMERP